MPDTLPGRTETSAEILARLERLHPREIDLSLDRVLRLLAALGDPQDKLDGVIHVAGTNGKGSVIAYLKAIFEATGERVHAFTSPHLVRFHERIALGQADGARQIGEEMLCDYLLRAEAANAGQEITFFEITTAAALLAFAEHPAGHVLLETGLGGRLDATNVVEKPALMVITPVSQDHAGYLGSRLEQVAFEKAGILKPGVPCVVTRQQREAYDVIAARAEEIGAPLLAQGQAWDAYEQHGRLVFQTESSLFDLPLPRLEGRHQIDNAGAALAAISALGVDMPGEAALARGLASAQWPARLQRLTHPALLAQLDEGSEIWLDGGHNPSAAQALAHAMADMEERAPRPLHLVCGMMTGKDAAAYFRHFTSLAQWTAAVPVPGRENAYSAATLSQIAGDAGLEAEPVASVGQALAASRARAGGPVRIIICGSLYLAGHVLGELEKENPGL